MSFEILYFSRPVLISDVKRPDRCEFLVLDRSSSGTDANSGPGGTDDNSPALPALGRTRRVGTRPGGTTETPDRNRSDTTATPAPAVRYVPKMPTPTKSQRPGFSTVWKSGPQPRIKPVIARDTTYGVSLLTGTTHGSNFAIPRHEISPHGNGAELQKAVQRSGAQPEVTRHPPQ